MLTSMLLEPDDGSNLPEVLLDSSVGASLLVGLAALESRGEPGGKAPCGVRVEFRSKLGLRCDPVSTEGGLLAPRAAGLRGRDLDPDRRRCSARGDR